MSASPHAVVPPEVRRQAERLFDVALWCLGQDVRHADNLLLRRGLTRERIPEGHKGTSAYTGPLPGGGALTLWGFGVLCQVRGESIFVPRQGFAPSVVEGPLPWPVFQAEQVGPLRPPVSAEEVRASRAALVALAEWLAEHEEWVAREMGTAYRHTCLSGRRKAPPAPVEGLASAWRRLAERLAGGAQGLLGK